MKAYKLIVDTPPIKKTGNDFIIKLLQEGQECEIGEVTSFKGDMKNIQSGSFEVEDFKSSKLSKNFLVLINEDETAANNKDVVFIADKDFLGVKVKNSKRKAFNKLSGTFSNLTIYTKSDDITSALSNIICISLNT
ncbi:hypothetical protein [Staphylococcus kloosii]|jgi:hypothetical protein|uniref:hypothetical protein n=1 Tax=Staphylococcus kloosii TaxID=29384 RepID=UPI00189D2951|nr:hypothetical protein [Staphylococcus kloosii]MBF7023651.1 hypothetical protein [Staphylococcus kloosii]